MIISASRRTDIPAFYAPWFMNRIRAGYCAVPNPFNPRIVSYVSLAPQDVDVIVFWTRHPRPLLPHLEELDRRGYRTTFQYTLLDYPRPRHIGRRIDHDFLSRGCKGEIFHVGDGVDNRLIILARQPLGNDLHVKHPQKSATETESERR